MVFKSKIKGNVFEREATSLLNELIPGAKFKRIPGSGSIGTNMDEPLLTGDITGKIDGINKKFKVECKVGYGGAKQFTLKKEWLDKIILESKGNCSTPFLLGKFSGSRAGVQVFVVLDVNTFATLLTQLAHKVEAADDQ